LDCSGKAAFSNNKTLLTSKLDFNLSKKLVRYYLWSIAFYGAESWTLWKVIRNTWKVLKCGPGEGWRR
jgi:hypothetical protein